MGQTMTEPTTSPERATAPRKVAIPEMAALLAVLIALVIAFSVTSPYFLSTANLLNILTAIAVTGVLAAPGTLLLIAGQVDLSVGAATALCGIVLATLVPIIGLSGAVIATLIVGCSIGLINGMLVTVVGLNSLIVTLGGLAAFRGVAFLLGDGQSVMLPNFGFLGTARPLGIPMPVILLLGFMAVVFVLLRFTVFGRNVYAIGANPVAARLVGIPSRRTIFIAFVASGVAMATAGMILTSQLGAAVPNAALGMELMVVTAIVLGGASLSGGRGSVSGTLLGLIIIGVLNNGLILMNVSSYWQQVANGVLLVAAVSFDRLRERFSPA
ncbi:MAG: ABC transporter permease [Propioniciclava sp.]